jgi:hypothetical protein
MNYRMLNLRRSIAPGLALLLLGACGGREPPPPQPVAVFQSQDRTMDCAAIRAETASNAQRLRELRYQKENRTKPGMWSTVAGAVNPAGWFRTDPEEAARAEEAALDSRQYQLGTLAGQRCVGASAGYSQPAPPASAPPRPLTPAAATTPVAPSPAPAPARGLECVDTEGARFRVTGSRCPPPSRPAQ